MIPARVSPFELRLVSLVLGHAQQLFLLIEIVGGMVGGEIAVPAALVCRFEVGLPALVGSVILAVPPLVPVTRRPVPRSSPRADAVHPGCRLGAVGGAAGGEAGAV